MGAAAPDMSGWVSGEGAFAMPDLSDRLVDQEREGRRAERASGREFPLATTSGSGEQPESERCDRDHRHCPRFERVQPAPEPGVVVDELIDQVVDAIVHGRRPVSTLAETASSATRRLTMVGVGG